jgi:hypothetical protein
MLSLQLVCPLALGRNAARQPVAFFLMYVLYLDESGNESDPSDRHFVLAGIAVFERQIHFLSEAVDELQNKHLPGYEPIPMHASPMRKGKDFWRKVPEATRLQMVHEMGKILSNADRRGSVLFAVAIEKSSQLHGEDAVQTAVEEICGRFNMFLSRLHREGDTQRGFLVFAEGRFHQRARTWVRTFRRGGTKIGTIRNFAEDLPYSASANDSRMLQLADHVAHAVFLKFERGDASLFEEIQDCFDQHEGRVHGLKHVRASAPS